MHFRMQCTYAILFNLIAIPVGHSVAAASNETMIKSIRDAVIDLCQSPNQEGEYIKVEGEGGAEVSVRILKFLGDASANGRANFTKEEWKGVRKVLDQNAENKDFRACVRELTPQFLSKFSESESKAKRVENFPWEGGIYSGLLVDEKPDGADGTLTFRSHNGFNQEFSWTYRGNFARGVRDGSGKISVAIDDGPKMSLAGLFENNAFLSGTGSLEFDRASYFEMRLGENTYTHVFGKYTGELKNKAPEKHWADGSFWRDLVADGHGELTGQVENVDQDKMYTLVWTGTWKDNGFLGNGRVTYPDGGYEEGLFHYRTLVEGKVISDSSRYHWGVFLNPPIVYSGSIRNGKPNGEGSMSNDGGTFPVKLDGTFADGKIVNGHGYRPACSEKNGCIYGSVGEFRNGELFTGHESIPNNSNGKFSIEEYDMKDGGMIKHASRPET